MLAWLCAVTAMLTALVLPATTGNNSLASGEYETIISEITGFTQVKHFYVHFVEKTTIIKRGRYIYLGMNCCEGVDINCDLSQPTHFLT